MITDCKICNAESVECRNLDLYVTGSEGLTLCHDCEMALVNYIRGLMNVATRIRFATYKRRKATAPAGTGEG